MRKRCISFLLVLIMLLGILPVASAQGESGFGYVYFDEGGVFLVEGEEARQAASAQKRHFSRSGSAAAYDVLGVAKRSYAGQPLLTNLNQIGEFLLHNALNGRYTSLRFTYGKKLTSGNVKDVLAMPYTYYPHFFGISYSYETIAETKQYLYTMTLGVDESIRAQEVAFTQAYVQKNPYNGGSEREYLLAAHDYIATLIDYDMQAYKSSLATLEKNYGHSHGQLAYCVYHCKKAVCAGYANALQLIGLHAGINIAGYSGNAKGAHRWNVVYSSEGARLIDVTWDDQPSAPGGIVYTYFWQADTAKGGRSISAGLTNFLFYINSTGALTDEPSTYTASRIPDRTGKGASIDLTAETLTIPQGFTVAGYSADGGVKWTKGAPKLDKILNKASELWLTDRMDKSKPVIGGNVIIFPAMQARPASNPDKLKINYLLLADPTGKTNGAWTLAPKNATAPVDLSAYQVTTANGKIPDAEKWAALPAEGVPVADYDKAKITYYARKPPMVQGATITPGSKPFKFSVSTLSKAPTIKANYTTEVLTLKKNNVLYAGLLSATEGATPTPATGTTATLQAGDFIATENSTVKLDISAYLGSSAQALTIWTQATAQKPASAKQVYTLAPRAAAPTGTITATGGKITIPATLQFLSGTKWGKLPKLTASAELQARIKPTAKATGVTDSGEAASLPTKATVQYGQWQEEPAKSAVLSVKFGE